MKKKKILNLRPLKYLESAHVLWWKIRLLLLLLLLENLSFFVFSSISFCCCCQKENPEDVFIVWMALIIG